MIKVLTIFGTRPEAIKMAPVIKEMQQHPEIESYVCVTAQHREMLDSILHIFNIVPDFDLNIMKPNQSLSEITVNALTGLENVINKVNPNLILVHGDTTTSFVGSLAAFYAKIPIGHVEAGLRTNNKYSPYPEEINRQFIDCVADLYFVPTELAKQNLLNENKDKTKIFVTGNTAIDALKYTVSDDYNHKYLEWAKDSKLIIITAHRRENLGVPMENMFNAIKRVVTEFPNVKAIYPIHKNPKVREIADRIFGDVDKIKITEPFNVFDFHNFMARSYMVLTDSGGIQEEAPSLGKPVLVMRNETERPEGVDAGTLKIVGTDENTIYKEFKLLLSDNGEYDKMSKTKNPYGDGFASERIVNKILENII
jgi:UDP-N-acetylglucosamine 2-epimerase (non-hydrolysing)